MRRRDRLGLDTLPLCRQHNAVGHELCQRLFVRMLQLAAAALVEVSTGRRDMMRSMRKRPIRMHDVTGHRTRNMLPVVRNAIAARGDADDFVWFAHRKVA